MAKKKSKKVRLMDGLPIVDGDNSLILEITPADVKNSKKKDPNNCAAARAGQRQFHTDVKVYISRTYIKTGKQWQRFVTPSAISREITSFDRGASFEPGTYTLSAPSPSCRLGVFRERGYGKKKKGKSPKPRHVTSNIRLSEKETRS